MVVTGLQLFGRLQQAGRDHTDRAYESDPDPDAAAGEKEVLRDGDDADEHEDRCQRAERDRERSEERRVGKECRL